MLEAKGISKTFGGQVVLDDADFSIGTGEVVGLVGHNGTGKTTLLDILCGRIRPDRGEVWADGRRLVPKPLWAGGTRVFRTYQVPRLFRQLTVVDNLKLGRWELKRKSTSASDLACSHGDLLGEALSIGQRRRITLDWLQARLDCFRYFLLDEPAAGADEKLVDQLLDFIAAARSLGCGVLLVEHRDGVLRRACDRVLYLRDGVLSDMPQPQFRQVDSQVPAPNPMTTSAVRLQVDDLVVARGAATIINGISFKARAGQVAVVTGPNGCGKSTLLRAIYGDPSCPLVAGDIRFEEKHLRTMDLRARIESGIQLMPQDGSLFPSMTVEDVLQAGVQAVRSEDWNIENVNRAKEDIPLLKRIWNRKCGLLSGGERRSVSLARLLLLHPKLALLDEPFAGLDAEGRWRIAEIISRIAKSGVLVLVAEQSVFVPLVPADVIVSLSDGR